MYSGSERTFDAGWLMKAGAMLSKLSCHIDLYTDIEGAPGGLGRLDINANASQTCGNG